jgi:acyl carrier protein
MDPVESTVKQFILDAFLQGATPGELAGTTPLISAGLLDSLATVRLVAFLEDHFRIRIEPHEAGVDHLDTIAQIASLVREKLQQ